MKDNVRRPKPNLHWPRTRSARHWRSFREPYFLNVARARISSLVIDDVYHNTESPTLVKTLLQKARFPAKWITSGWPVTREQSRKAAIVGWPRIYCSFAYSALACFRIGMSGSASFHSVRKASYALFALILSPDKAYALPSCKCASAPMGSAVPRQNVVHPQNETKRWQPPSPPRDWR
jgi:hypothetical protein